jgi:L-2,4-diaminobutyrate decarboxylase
LDDDFQANSSSLHRAVDLLTATHGAAMAKLSPHMPEAGIGSAAAMEAMAPYVLGGASHLGAATAFAHMDPPTPWVTWATTMWNASLNQNLLHPETAPAARQIEERIVGWLAPFFGMEGGHMTPGSTLANLTALWAARERASVTEVAASAGSHLSVAKAAHVLGLRYRPLPSTRAGAIMPEVLDREDLRRTALVLTAGTTSTGAIDALSLTGRAAWTHVDAAWAGPLRLSTTHTSKLDGIERADSVAVSGHKLLFQPKESGLVFFREVNASHAAISFSGGYLTAPNVGLLGSHGAVAVPLLATILAWGRSGLAARIERCVALADQFAGFVESETRLELLTKSGTGIVAWRPRHAARTETIYQRLPPGAASLTTLAGEPWIRNVAANPNADVRAFMAAVQTALDEAD